MLQTMQTNEEKFCEEAVYSEDYVDLIYGRQIYGELDLNQFAVCRQPLNSDYTALYLERLNSDVTNFQGFEYVNTPNCYGLLDTGALEASDILRVQNYPGLNLKGQGVLMGFIDTGIDYQNDVFKQKDGTTRIVSIWDQTDRSGTPPNGFIYGSEYSREEINRALANQNPLTVVPSSDEIGHGTFMASVAAGNEMPEQQFTGAAPEATIAVVKLKQAKNFLKRFYVIPQQQPAYQENDIMAALRYLVELAEQLKMPLVIGLALGTNMGDHNGSSPLGSMLGSYAVEGGKGIAVGTGNEANQAHHFEKEFVGDSDTEEVEISVGADCEGFTMECWASSQDFYKFDFVSPSGQEVIAGTIGGLTHDERYNFPLDRSVVYISYQARASRAGYRVVFMRFQTPSQGIWKVRVRKINISVGKFHLWLPMREFLSSTVVFLRPTPDITLTEPSAAAQVITVGTYNHTTNSIYLDSGRGYTPRNLIKPDFACPGVDVSGVYPRNRFGTNTGSSASAAIAAGAMALLMEWIIVRYNMNYVSTLDLKSLLIRGVEQNQGILFPNRSWGYGKLNLYQSIEQTRVY